MRGRLKETAPGPAEPGPAVVDTGDDSTTSEVLAALRAVVDPCCKEKEISIVDMGLIESIKIGETGVTVSLTLTSGWCPFAVDLVSSVEQAVESVIPCGDVTVDIGWERVWGTERLSESARKKLTFLPSPRDAGTPSRYLGVVATSNSTEKDSR